MAKAHFGRKERDIEELIADTERAKKHGYDGSNYTVTREVELSPIEWLTLGSDLLEDQNWIRPREGGILPDGTIKAIRVTCEGSEYNLLVNPEGYDYPRYTALEPKE